MPRIIVSLVLILAFGLWNNNVTPKRYQKILSVLYKRQADLTVVVDRLHIGRNLAAIRRTCDAMGVGTLHAVVPEGFQQKRFAGTTMGSHKWVELCRHRTTLEAFSVIREEGMQILAADVSASALDYRSVDFTRPTAIIMGAEVDGVSQEAQAMADGFLSLPMLGMVESFNVSVACALVLSEAMRQRREKGMLDEPSLPKEEIDRLAFEWGYPKLKRYYQGKKLPYPALDHEGQLIEG